MKKALLEKRFFLLDMDGTIYLDDYLFDGTLEFLEAVRKKGGKYLFVTNNSSKSTDAYVRKLEKIGISSSEDDFLTSTDATILYIKKNYPLVKFFCMGTTSFVQQLKNAGIRITMQLEEDTDGVLISNDTELNFEKLDIASRLLTTKANIVYIATNPDWVCPTSYGYVPDCGSFAEMLWRATGKRPYFVGKPRPEMLLLAMEKYGFSKKETLMIGDRVYTDIASGYNAGVDTVFVLTGEGTMQDAQDTETPPTFIMKNIREVLENI